MFSTQLNVLLYYSINNNYRSSLSCRLKWTHLKSSTIKKFCSSQPVTFLGPRKISKAEQIVADLLRERGLIRDPAAPTVQDAGRNFVAPKSGNETGFATSCIDEGEFYNPAQPLLLLPPFIMPPFY